MTLGLIQYGPVWEDKEASILKIEQMLAEVKEDIDLMIFPEMTLTGFTMRSAKYAEDLSGASMTFFSDLARQNQSHVIAGIIERDGRVCFNTLLHINREGDLITKYRKIHPFSFTGENRHYSAGSFPAMTVIDEIPTGLSICYDLRFPELYRVYAQEKAKLIVNIANWPHARIDHWYALLKARAIENQSFVVGVNRIGRDKANEYDGRSTLFDPLGREICSRQDREEVITVSFSIEQVNEVRSRFPFLQDIRLLKRTSGTQADFNKEESE